MQGKPLNAARASLRKTLDHSFFGPLVTAIGVGVAAECEPQQSRYERLLVLTDPDADGKTNLEEYQNRTDPTVPELTAPAFSTAPGL